MLVPWHFELSADAVVTHGFTLDGQRKAAGSEKCLTWASECGLTTQRKRLLREEWRGDIILVDPVVVPGGIVLRLRSNVCWRWLYKRSLAIRRLARCG